MAEDQIFKVLRVGDDVDDVQVNEELSEIWPDLIRNPEVSDDPALSKLLAQPKSPFTAAREHAEFGIAETIAISIAGSLASAALKAAASALWEKWILPELRRRLSGDIAEVTGESGT
jgi:hypothetical protein